MIPSDLITREGTDAAKSNQLSAYYNASRLRTDTWDTLRDSVQKLHDAERRGADVSKQASEIVRLFELLKPVETYWAFPGKRGYAELLRLFEREDYESLLRVTDRILRLLVSDAYRTRNATETASQEYLESGEFEVGMDEAGAQEKFNDTRPYFEVLIVDNVSPREEERLRQKLVKLRRNEDEFIYNAVVVPTFEDALIAILFNYSIQSCVVRYSFPLRSHHRLEVLQQTIESIGRADYEAMSDRERSIALGRLLKRMRPELDLFLVTDAPVEDIAGTASQCYRRVFYRQEDHVELHLSILKGISERYDTPFFTALRNYSHKPTGVFHAMPLSRGKSIAKSHWIRDMEEFYGSNIFLAETSATTGGLDSLLQPHGSLKQAQALAARAFGARRTYFVTNGTSTANKIVMQALVRPGDTVLVSRDCHKSHHYALILAGAHPVYMDPYPLSPYSMYGAVSLEEIKRQLFVQKKAGKLDRVRMVLLTNMTFDGVTYNARAVMEELLAIKPDLIFLWDEAWFAYGHFTPITRDRMAMQGAADVRAMLKDPAYAAKYAKWREEFDAKPGTEEKKSLAERLLPDPAKARVRVYSTQSTHKTLTSLRQGSMIHIFDRDFEQHSMKAFNEAYMTHTSTSPNYQILASLDLGRRQVELEGFELVQKSIELAMTLRERIRSNALTNKYFTVLGPKDLIPARHRPSGIELYYDPKSGWSRMETAWETDEFALDPTRVTIEVGRTGMDGDEFKNHLMNDFDIQINKTSRNTVLFMIHIGTTRGAIAFLIEVLATIAQRLEERAEDQNDIDQELFTDRVKSLTQDFPPLPNFSRFHKAFLAEPGSSTPEGDMRKAFFLAYDECEVEYFRIGGEIEAAMAAGRAVVSASFVTPYPPGFPILVPGQVVSEEILSFMKALDVKEIHGYNPNHGLSVFTQEALEAAEAAGPTSPRRAKHGKKS